MKVHYTLPVMIALAFVGAAGTAAAHEHVKVADGKYEIVLGWKNEPAYAGQQNGLDLCVNRVKESHGDEGGHGHGAPERVKGLLQNLTVTYEYGGKKYPSTDAEKKAFNWRGQWGKEGCYTGQITPTREGEYTVHLVGNIEGHPVDVRIKPHEIVANSRTMFPEPDLTPEELSAKVKALEAKVASIDAKAQTDPGPVTEKTNTPGFTIAIAALAALGAALLVRKRK